MVRCSGASTPVTGTGGAGGLRTMLWTGPRTCSAGSITLMKWLRLRRLLRRTRPRTGNHQMVMEWAGLLIRIIRRILGHEYDVR